MKATGRAAKTLSIDKTVLQEIERTRGNESTSERVNRLLRAGLEAEQREELRREAEMFFQSTGDRTERRGFQSASVRSIARDE
jgi:hypothetical protein